MFAKPIIYDARNLPFNNEMKEYWDKNGFIIFENFYTSEECNYLKNRANKLINSYDFKNHPNKSLFDTNNQKHAEDDYFLNSGDKIHFFF